MTDEMRADLVFEGGGVKGIALAGAFSILEEHGFPTQNVAGTSAGAVVGSLVAAGYTAKELHDLLQETPFSSFEDKGWEDRIIGPRDAAVDPEGPRDLRGQGLPCVDPAAVRREGHRAVRRPAGRGRGRPSVEVPAPGGRLRRHASPAAPAAARRRGPRHGPRSPRGRGRGADEHEHPRVLRAVHGEGARAGGGPGRRRHAVELPGVGVRLRRGSRMADVRAQARRPRPQAGRRRDRRRRSP